MKELVSIIVPVYNVEQYIRRAVDSLLAQTYANIEVILVDDGSPDRCGAICNEYAQKDSRVKVIHQENGGVSRARQTGLDAATGDYVIHADPDDWVEPNMIEELMAAAHKSGADMVTCDYYQNERLVQGRYESRTDLLHKLIANKICITLFNALIRRDFIISHNICFTPTWLSCGEDMLFIIRTLTAGAVPVHLPKAFYHYINRLGSIVSTRSRQSFESNKFLISEFSKMPGISEDELFARKRHLFIYAYEGRWFHEVNTMYPEIRERLRKGADGNIHSISSQLARCMIYPPLLVWSINKIYRVLRDFKAKLAGKQKK